MELNFNIKYFGILLLLFPSCLAQQKPDKEFDVSVKSPTYISSYPKVLFDEAHYNMHTTSGTYSPFVNLIKNDGYLVKKNQSTFSNSSLEGYDVLIISNAKGGKRNFKYKPAFTEEECTVVRQWILKGGSLLLIADHYPLGIAANNLSMQFGVHMHSGEVYDSIYFEGDSTFRDKLVFSRENNLLQDNEITNGRNINEHISRVVSDRGQSISIPDNSIVLLKLSKQSYHILPDSIWDIGKTTYTRFDDPVSAYGNCQGLAIKFGQGRVVILGEAAMLTAQLYKREKFGMNTPGNDNKQFVLNIMHWLSE
jgi:hypothetical protein